MWSALDPFHLLPKFPVGWWWIPKRVSVRWYGIASFVSELNFYTKISILKANHCSILFLWIEDITSGRKNWKNLFSKNLISKTGMLILQVFDQQRKNSITKMLLSQKVSIAYLFSFVSITIEQFHNSTKCICQDLWQLHWYRGCWISFIKAI